MRLAGNLLVRRLRGLPEPVFVELGHFFKVILPGQPVTKIPKLTVLDPDERTILGLVRKNGSITTRDAMKATGRSRPAVRRKLAHLERLHLIEFKGTMPSDPTGRYISPDGKKPRAGQIE